MQNRHIREINGLVNLEDVDDTFILDLKYASKDNFTGKAVYPVNVCVLQKETAIKLIRANEEFKNMGLKIKVWDAYRPIYVQRIFWDLVQDDRFVANPNKNASRHNRGTAVDITLVDSYGRELRMPSKFDDFSFRAYRDRENLNEEENRNLRLMTDVMTKNGFITIDTEWWHFEDNDYNKYKIYDIRLEEFIC